MNVDPEVVVIIGKILAVSAGATLLLAVMSFVVSALMLEGVTALDRWIDPSRKNRKAEPRVLPPSVN